MSLDANWAQSDIRALLLGGASVPAGAQDPDLDTVADLLAVSGVAELAAQGYQRSAVVARSAVPVDTSNAVDLTSLDLTFPPLGTGAEVARAVVLFIEPANPTSDSDRDLVTYHDTGFPITLAGGQFVIGVPNGVMRVA
jgi:hypothetical protein